MKPVHLTAAAEDDLACIRDYIAAENARAAEVFLDRVERVLELLARQPGMGVRRDDLRPGVRAKVLGQYVLVYRELSKRTDVLRVLHGARDMRSALNP